MSNPALSVDERQSLTSQLMRARREVAIARKENNSDRLRAARLAVDAAKIALGERGAVWWVDGAPDYNRHMARNTPYAEWYATADT